jgi:hypothetical protein
MMVHHPLTLRPPLRRYRLVFGLLLAATIVRAQENPANLDNVPQENVPQENVPQETAPETTQTTPTELDSTKAAPAAKHPEGIEKTMGVVKGGWEYVYAVYTLSLVGLVVFSISLFVRRPRGSRAERPSERPSEKLSERIERSAP